MMGILGGHIILSRIWESTELALMPTTSPVVLQKDWMLPPMYDRQMQCSKHRIQHTASI